ncbi:MAG: GFA family protein [Geminicoccales bacterium]
MSTITGRCFCQAVQFAYEGEPKWTLHCHCEDCRRAVSAPMATWISVPKGRFRFTAGEPKYYESSKGVRRGFCGRCGSPLTYESEEHAGEIHVLAVALSDQSNVKPSAHIAVKEQLPWFETADELPRYARWRSDGPPVRHGPRGK